MPTPTLQFVQHNAGDFCLSHFLQYSPESLLLFFAIRPLRRLPLDLSPAGSFCGAGAERRRGGETFDLSPCILSVVVQISSRDQSLIIGCMGEFSVQTYYFCC